MANIRVDVNYTIKDGSKIAFRAPVDCSAITGLVVYYVAEDGTDTSKEFILADAHGHDVGDIDHLFAENVIVKVILDVTAGMAYVQNADTNAYIERTFMKKTDFKVGVDGNSCSVEITPTDNGYDLTITNTNGADGSSVVTKVPIYHGKDGMNGADGGYYTPSATINESGNLVIAWTGSKPELPALPVQETELPGANGSGGGLPIPATAAVGQYIVVSAVDENGKVTATEAVTIETGFSVPKHKLLDLDVQKSTASVE